MAWIDGEDPCSIAPTQINLKSENVCGHTFELNNGYSYQFAYCGTSSFALLNADGSYNAKCSGAGSNNEHDCDPYSPDGPAYFSEWNC